MRRIATLFFVLLGFATVGFSKDVFLSIGGSVGTFRTDMRLFNPSTTKDIQVQAYLLATGNVDNSAVQAKTITVPKRQMMVFDDVLSSLFQTSGLAGIRLSSSDDFVATQRIYAATATGTLGQFLYGIDSSTAQKNGVLIQIKSSTSFRTNLGVLNPNGTAANTTWRLYDKNNALIGAAKTLALPPFAVIGPTEIRGFFGSPEAAGADLSDAWVSYASDQPLVAYASVVDNFTTDPTYIAAAADSGATSSDNTPPPTTKTVNVVARNGQISVTGATGLKVGDTVNVHIQILEGPHGFELQDPDGSPVFPSHAGAAPGTTFDDTFKVTKTGTYSYFCTNAGCGAHTGMFGTFDIGGGSGPGNPGY